MNMRVHIFFLFVFFISCATSAEQAPKYDVLNYNTRQGNELEKYLVKLNKYTTNGKKYHKKHKKYLYGVANTLVKEKKYNITSESIGFYYDKKQSLTKLYFGVDMRVPSSKVWQGSSYYKNGQRFITMYLEDIMAVLISCDGIVEEDEVKGMLLGIAWKRKGRREFINVWVPKDLVKKYLEKSITFREFVISSVVTDMSGEIIRLKI